MSTSGIQDEDIVSDRRDLNRMQKLYKIMGIVFLIFNSWFNFLGPVIGISFLSNIKDDDVAEYWLINLSLTRAIMNETLMLMMILVLIFVFQVSYKASANKTVEK